MVHTFLLRKCSYSCPAHNADLREFMREKCESLGIVCSNSIEAMHGSKCLCVGKGGGNTLENYILQVVYSFQGGSPRVFSVPVWSGLISLLLSRPSPLFTCFLQRKSVSVHPQQAPCSTHHRHIKTINRLLMCQSTLDNSLRCIFIKGRCSDTSPTVPNQHSDQMEERVVNQQ